METAEPEEVMDNSAIFDPPGQLQGGIPSTRGRRSREAIESSQDVTGWSRQKLETVCKAHAIKGYSGKKREWMLQRVQAVLQIIHSFGICTSALKTHKFICTRPEGKPALAAAETTAFHTSTLILPPDTVTSLASRKSANCVPRLLNIIFHDMFVMETLGSESRLTRDELDSGSVGSERLYWNRINAKTKQVRRSGIQFGREYARFRRRSRSFSSHIISQSGCGRYPTRGPFPEEVVRDVRRCAPCLQQGPRQFHYRMPPNRQDPAQMTQKSRGDLRT